jgi:hypothetical protein
MNWYIFIEPKVQKRLLSNDTKNLIIFNPEKCRSSQNSYEMDPGSGIQNPGSGFWDQRSKLQVPEKTYPGSGSSGKKNTGSQIRIRHTGGKLKICTRLNNNKISTVP